MKYRELILGWAAERNLIEGSTYEKQLDKLFEELGEFAGHVARGKIDLTKDDLGDMYVVLTILSAQLGLKELRCPKPSEKDILQVKPSSLYAILGGLVAILCMKDLGVPPDERDIEEMVAGSIFTLHCMATKSGFDFEECVSIAWDEIKDRKGKMINGVFVKEADLV